MKNFTISRDQVRENMRFSRAFNFRAGQVREN